jgi:hypothetical protein
MVKKSLGNTYTRNLFIAGALAVLVCTGACVICNAVYCIRANRPPKAPIYPESILVEQVSSGVGTSSRPRLTSRYVTADPPEAVLAFYEDRGSCRDPVPLNRVLCDGESVPFGEYFAYIDLASYETNGETAYALEIKWRGCTWELEE